MTSIKKTTHSQFKVINPNVSLFFRKKLDIATFGLNSPYLKAAYRATVLLESDAQYNFGKASS